MAMNEMIVPYKEHMDKSVSHLKNELAAIRAGRANPAVLDKLSVDYYGTPTKINAMAAVAVSEARVLVITPWDPSTIKAINKAILASDIGINPQSDGRVIRLVFPPLTEEKRKDIVKDVSKMAEESKVALRSIRRDAIEKMKSMKKEGLLTEDDLKQGEKKVQDITDKNVKVIDEHSAAKQKEVLTL